MCPRGRHAWALALSKMATTKRFAKVFHGLKRSAYTALFQRSCTSSSHNTTHFGYETVTEDEKAEKGTALRSNCTYLILLFNFFSRGVDEVRYSLNFGIYVRFTDRSLQF